MSESLDTTELKMQALVERIASLTAEYENKVADLRVAYTVVSKERDDLRARLDEVESDSRANKSPSE